MVAVTLLRPWWTPTRSHQVGEVIEVSPDLARRMERARPPYAERVRVRKPKAPRGKR